MYDSNYILFDHNDFLLELSFDELKGEDCYDSLRMYYDISSGYAAVYNYYMNKIIVFNLFEVVSKKGKYKKIIEVNMGSTISNALIFSQN